MSEFIDTANWNTYATFANLREVWAVLVRIDGTFRRAIDAMENSRAWFAGFFLLGAHASYLGALRLSASTQLPEAYMVLRGCLESSLYGLFLHGRPDLQETWLGRHESDEATEQVRREFRIGSMLDLLEARDTVTGRAAQELYDRTIDFGAHPNERALMQNLRMTRNEEAVRFERNYLVGDSTALRLCLKTNAQVGVCSLRIFRLVMPERFDLLGLSDDIVRLSGGL